MNRLRERAEKNEARGPVMKDKKRTSEMFSEVACKEWIDVRSFGQVFAFKGTGAKGVSVGVRGPVSIHTARSVDPIDMNSMQLTKHVNTEAAESKGTDA